MGMGFDGTSRPLPVRQSFYPTGTAAGGNQGRLGSMLNGSPGAKQGSMPRKNPQVPVRPGQGAPVLPGSTRPVSEPRPRVPAGAGFKWMPVYGFWKNPKALATATPMRYIKSWKKVKVTMPIPTTTSTGVNPVKPPQPASTVMDAQYWLDLNEAENSFKDVENQNTAAINALRDTTQYGGKTILDFLYGRAENAWRQNLRGTRADLSRRGLLRSGAAQQQYLGLDEQMKQQAVELDNQYGQRRISEYARMVEEAKLKFLRDQQAITAAARERYLQQRLQANQNTYNQTTPPGGS